MPQGLWITVSSAWNFQNDIRINLTILNFIKYDHTNFVIINYNYLTCLFNSLFVHLHHQTPPPWGQCSLLSCSPLSLKWQPHSKPSMRFSLLGSCGEFRKSFVQVVVLRLALKVGWDFTLWSWGRRRFGLEEAASSLSGMVIIGLKWEHGCETLCKDLYISAAVDW